MSKQAFVLNAYTPDTFTVNSAYQNLCRINTGACVLEDHIEELLVSSAVSDKQYYKALHSALATSLMLKQLSSELLEHLDIAK